MTWAGCGRSRTGTSARSSASVPGVAEVSSVGGFPIEYQVAPDPDRLRLFGVPRSRTSSTPSRRRTRRRAGTWSTKGTPSTWSAASAGSAPRRAWRRLVRPEPRVADLENVVLSRAGRGDDPPGRSRRGRDRAGFRRGVLEKDGNEVTGGVVLMANGENPLEVTRRIKAKIRELQAGLPPGVRIVPFYDRTPLIEGAIGTVSRRCRGDDLGIALCPGRSLLHVRTSLVIASTLPLAALSSFLIMADLAEVGLVDIQANAMSLAGYRDFDRRAGGFVGRDGRERDAPAARAVRRAGWCGATCATLCCRPAWRSGGRSCSRWRSCCFRSCRCSRWAGSKGRCSIRWPTPRRSRLRRSRVLAITLVPALCTVFIRGRLRSEQENPLVRGVIEVYRPVLSFLLDQPAVLAWVLGVTFLLGFAPLGSRPATLVILVHGDGVHGALARAWVWAVVLPAFLVTAHWSADQSMTPLGREFMTPLDEGMVMDMPITVPRASVTESVDDLKARDMVLCRFPEVDMVVGKAGRAETPTDPAPMDMIETMVNFRPRDVLAAPQARAGGRPTPGPGGARRADTRDVISEPPVDAPSGTSLIEQAVAAALARFDAASREYAYHRNQEMLRESAGISPTSTESRPIPPRRGWSPWRRHVEQLDARAARARRAAYSPGW